MASTAVLPLTSRTCAYRGIWPSKYTNWLTRNCAHSGPRMR
ncbi:Uncharacterised protein [Bordetella pertussis]|nr:Uncharacterised protein [Bordetella pertussis]